MSSDYAKRSLTIEPEFLHAASELPKNLKVTLMKVLRLLSEDVRHPSLQTKKVQSARGDMFECRVDQKIRLIYDNFQGTLRCWYVGEHDYTLAVAQKKYGTGSVIVDDIEVHPMEGINEGKLFPHISVLTMALPELEGFLFNTSEETK